MCRGVECQLGCCMRFKLSSLATIVGYATSSMSGTYGASYIACRMLDGQCGVEALNESGGRTVTRMAASISGTSTNSTDLSPALMLLFASGGAHG
jgi:hypothetical protein